MIWRTCLTLTRVVLILAAFCWGIAQNNSQNSNQSQAPAQSKSAKGPQQMRGTTNAHRWAAAANHADRRASQVRKHHGKVK